MRPYKLEEASTRKCVTTRTCTVFVTLTFDLLTPKYMHFQNFLLNVSMLSSVILTASVFEISCEKKQTDRQTDRQTNAVENPLSLLDFVSCSCLRKTGQPDTILFANTFLCHHSSSIV